MRMGTGFTLLALAGYGAGCGEDSGAQGRACWDDDCLEAAAAHCETVQRFGDDQLEDWPTIDGELAAVARRQPGFGGFRIEGDQIVLLMVSPTQVRAEAVRDELARIYPSTPIRQLTIVLESTPYDYDELLSFYVRARNVLSLDGVVFSDINESRGRIEYGVVDEEAADCVRTNLQQLSVPTDAAVTQISEPIRRLGD